METPRRTAILPGAFRLFGAISALFALALLPAACSDSGSGPSNGGLPGSSALSSGEGGSSGGSSPAGSSAGGSSESGESGNPGSSAALSSGEGTTSSSGAVATTDWRDTCLAIVNEYRATEELAPLARATDERQLCADEQSGEDLASGQAHSHFGSCGEMAQNTGPNVRMASGKSYGEFARLYLRMMWEDEKALVISGERDLDNDEDYHYIGHYLNMKGNYASVACGFAVSADGATGWFNVDFFR